MLDLGINLHKSLAYKKKEQNRTKYFEQKIELTKYMSIIQLK